MEVLLISSAITITFVALLLIGIILIQQSKGGGFGSAFGGMGETVFGAHTGSHLIKVTITLMVVFFVLILMMGMITAHGLSERTRSQELADRIAAQNTPAVPAVDSVQANVPSMGAVPAPVKPDTPLAP